MVDPKVPVERYKPAPDFEEDATDPDFGLSLSDSQELWLIQCPINQPQNKDEKVVISLRLEDDGNLGSFKSSSGKSYDLVSFASQKPDATVILPSGSMAGKICRSVCFMRYPEPSDFEKPVSRFNKSGASGRSSMPRSSATPSSMRIGTSRTTLTSEHVTQENAESSKRSKKKRVRDSPCSSEQMPKSAGPSYESKPDSNVSNMLSGLASSQNSHGEKIKKKKKRKLEE